MEHEDFRLLIDQYLAYSLENPALEEFEAHYFECDECYIELKLRERLQTKNVPIYSQSSKSHSWFWLPKTALTIASFLLLATLFIFVTQSLRHSRFLEKISAFTPPPYLVSEIRGASGENYFSKAMNAYTQKDYGLSLQFLNKIEDKKNPKIQFFTGMNYLLTGDNREAIAHFDCIIKEMNPSYYDEAIYYKGIALIRSNRIEDALDQFRNVAQMFSPYASKAYEMIQKLNKNSQD